MEKTLAISIAAPEEFAGDMTQFAEENPKETHLQRLPNSEEAARDLGFEPITAAIVGAWLLKLSAAVAVKLAAKLIVDQIYKKLQADKSGKYMEVRVGFPNGFTLTVRSGDTRTPEQLRQIVQENLKP